MFKFKVQILISFIIETVMYNKSSLNIKIYPIIIQIMEI